jgi:Tfp pilus assembly protein PilP
VKVVPVAPKPAAVAVKPAAASAKPAVISVAPAPAKTVSVQTKPAAVQAVKANVGSAAKPANAPGVKPAVIPAVKPLVSGHPAAVATAAPKSAAAPAKSAGAFSAAKDPFKKQVPAVARKGPSTVVAVKDSKPENKKPEPRKISANGRRDPFISPVVNLGAVGSGCSSGKRCLAIDQIALRGVVKSDNGMIAVVVNAMDKAYFLRENDPVFNGYVVKITGDSIVFKETFKDKLGKPLTRDVTKTISRPVA